MANEYKREIWMTDVGKILLVRIVDRSGLYYYEYAFDEYLMLEKSPAEYNLVYIGEL